MNDFFSKELIVKKNQQTAKQHAKFPCRQRVHNWSISLRNSLFFQKWPTFSQKHYFLCPFIWTPGLLWQISLVIYSVWQTYNNSCFTLVHHYTQAAETTLRFLCVMTDQCEFWHMGQNMRFWYLLHMSKRFVKIPMWKYPARLDV